MIPWNAFRQTENPSDLRVDLNEYNLRNHIVYGPTQFRRGLDSPMLELAHERQFAISQLGTRSVGFEAEHSARIQTTLQMLNDLITPRDIAEACRPTSPYVEDLIDLRPRSRCFSPLPALDLSHQRSAPSLPPSTGTQEQPSRSPLALQELMNPAPPPSNLKRKAFNDFSPGILADDEPEYVSEVDSDLVRGPNPIKYPRANYIVAEGVHGRIRKVVRMRRSQSGARYSSHEHVCDQITSRNVVSS